MAYLLITGFWRERTGNLTSVTGYRSSHTVDQLFGRLAIEFALAQRRSGRLGSTGVVLSEVCLFEGSLRGSFSRLYVLRCGRGVSFG